LTEQAFSGKVFLIYVNECQIRAETVTIQGEDVIIYTPFSELCTHGKRAYKYALQASGIYFIIKYINQNLWS